MTKVIVLGEKKREQDEKPIRFYKVLTAGYNVVDAGSVPSDFHYIELICKKYSAQYDLMFAYNDPDKRNHGNLFLGYFNDGVVEYTE